VIRTIWRSVQGRIGMELCQMHASDVARRLGLQEIVDRVLAVRAMSARAKTAKRRQNIADLEAGIHQLSDASGGLMNVLLIPPASGVTLLAAAILDIRRPSGYSTA